MNRLRPLTLLLVTSIAALFFGQPERAYACGGFFCQNSPVDQNAERIIFTDNGDGTTSALIQIQYFGEADEFSWILPLPNPITADDIAVLDDSMAAFLELETMTNPRYIPPPTPNCAEMMMMDSAVMESGADGVDVFATGEVGPFGFDVIGSDDPMALIDWLRDNDYRVEPEMEPLINVYVEESFYFLAMQLLPNQGATDVEPIQITYQSTQPMIPLRLTAVAAADNMAVLTWFFADTQAKPANYAHMRVPDDDIVFFTFGGNNYRSLLAEYADREAGKAFFTEYAMPTEVEQFTHPILRDMANKHRYLTRLNTVISPDEMTVDPIFEYDQSLPDMSNVHDLSEANNKFQCEIDEQGIIGDTIESVAEAIGGDDSQSIYVDSAESAAADGNSTATDTTTVTTTEDESSGGLGGTTLALIIGIAVGIFGGSRLMRGRRENADETP